MPMQIAEKSIVDPGVDGHVVESWPARLEGERTAGIVGSRRHLQTAVNGGSPLPARGLRQRRSTRYAATKQRTR